MTVGDFKSRFSQVITSVMEGEEVEILYGRAKKPVAKVSNLSKNNQKRQIGTYDNIATFSEVGDSKISVEDLLLNSEFILLNSELIYLLLTIFLYYSYLDLLKRNLKVGLKLFQFVCQSHQEKLCRFR